MGETVVLIEHGPYKRFNIIDHGCERLEGIQRLLKDEGAKVILRRSSNFDQCSISLKGKIVFSCPITSLEYGGDGQLDPIAQNAFQKVKAAV
ncbi:Oidioi.mRNA.OKI2018_I69.XSR.g15276.t1.cds [Oikopleura dioica]|uniref:Oidioi.mRNA.OKI2018_I69.XSR.g15276.t1.cds n=1 Tax=Oikopleura dioica TaxID=34765 RepID=A0ABN7SHH6_OIKDI|nr:Oidioi.mRNA.OKI2018_I69.XSR.g15276.t1.cds [Oikopleura dioica]